MNINNDYTINKRKKADRVYKVILMMTIIIFLALSSWLLTIYKNNLINLQYSEVQSLNKDVTYILENRRHKISEFALILDKYISEGKSTEELLTYLQMEYNVMATLDAEYSDVYGYICGEYLDGSGWVHGDDFIPKERPWYIAGLRANGEIAFASPYIDAISKNLIISYCKLLSDGESVISFDVQLTNMQKLVDDTVSKECLETIIFDENETILADSNKDNISFCFNELNDGFYKLLYEKYSENPDSNFEFKYGGISYYVFNTPISDGMKQLVLMDASQMFKPLNRTLQIGIIIFIAIIALVIAIFRDIDYRRRLAENDLQKISKLYFEANTDILTDLYNRRAYEDKLNEFKDNNIPNKTVYFSFDLNGLKQANDTLGHFAGDKLLRGAASAIRNSFEKYGSIYRIGGDEFAAIVEIDSDKIMTVIESFKKEMKNWSTDNNMSLSISYGYAERKKHMNVSFHDLIDLSDKNMYIEKINYYKKNGNDRRHDSQEAD